MSCTMEIDNMMWFIEGKMDRNGTLNYKATPTAADVRGTVDVPYDDHHEAAADMLNQLRFRS